MNATREILVPTDFSTESQAAFAPARELAGALKAHIALLAVVEDPARLFFGLVDNPGLRLNVDVDLVAENLLKEARERLAAVAKKAGIDAGDALLVVRGTSPAREIVRVARERGSDFIVLATHGRSGVSHALLGSTAERVVRESPCPVLTVRCRN